MDEILKDEEIPRMRHMILLLDILWGYLKNRHLGFPGGSDGTESTCNVGDLGFIPGLGRSSGKGNGYQLQYSFFFF